MKEKNGLIINFIEIVTLIILYYIVGIKNLFLYVISLSLYNVFVSAFTHLSIPGTLPKIKNKAKLFNYLTLVLMVFSLMFLLLGILVSDIINIILNINDLLIIFVFMGLSIITKPFIKLLAEYLVWETDNTKFMKIVDFYHVFDSVLLVVIALLFFKVFKLPINISIGMLYLSKIISAVIILLLMYLINKDKWYESLKQKDDINYKKEIKRVLVKDSYRSLIIIVKNSFYYISIITIYVVLTSRYNYEVDKIRETITFIYLYAIMITNLIIMAVKLMNNELPKEMTLTSRIYNNFKIMLSMAIIFSIVSPLSCKLLFNTPKYAIYLGMINFMAIFSLLYDITYDFVKNKKIIHIGLVSAILVKIITIIPLINAFYRMGYNLIYGDVISSILGMLIATVINYIYIRNRETKKENYFTKLLDIFYENIILCIILIVIQFVIPIDTDNYFKAFGLLIIYLGISIAIIKLKNMKRG